MGRKAEIEYGILVHGGAGAPDELTDGCERAGLAGFAVVREGGSALDGVVEAVRILEDDGRFNAGTGSVLRLDGITREMDSAVMDSERRLGIVISLRGIRNPVLAAKALTATPHVALSGEGAARFAMAHGIASLDHVPEEVRERCRRMREVMKTEGFARDYPHWKGQDLGSLWNFPSPPDEDMLLCDTVGAVALDRKGAFAVASSTGGASPMLLGRVGDTAMPGCGFYAGKAGAVAVTGLGEEMIRAMTARTVYDLIAKGAATGVACEKGVALFPPETAVGIIALSRKGFGLSANRILPPLHSCRLRVA